MKFKNKETGKVFGNESYLFCGRYEGHCYKCPVFKKIKDTGRGKISDYCDDWIFYHPKEAAALMGYEVVEENPIPDEGSGITRRSILHKAEKCVCEDRDKQYKGPENSFKAIASLWNSFLYSKGLIVNDSAEWKGIKPEDVAVMMALLKIARISTGAFKEDSYVDACGYLACGGELEGREANEN